MHCVDDKQLVDHVPPSAEASISNLDAISEGEQPTQGVLHGRKSCSYLRVSTCKSQNDRRLPTVALATGFPPISSLTPLRMRSRTDH